mmetsp:Transcript_26884/g.86355  ORF Transcript_26884/g.86355 Transcript_26884/m.86355 type:complete len:257 (+) Transcript_26884:2745-3515(+)
MESGAPALSRCGSSSPPAIASRTASLSGLIGPLARTGVSRSALLMRLTRSACSCKWKASPGGTDASGPWSGGTSKRLGASSTSSTVAISSASSAGAGAASGGGGAHFDAPGSGSGNWAPSIPTSFAGGGLTLRTKKRLAPPAKGSARRAAKSGQKAATAPGTIGASGMGTMQGMKVPLVEFVTLYPFSSSHSSPTHGSPGAPGGHSGGEKGGLGGSGGGSGGGGGSDGDGGGDDGGGGSSGGGGGEGGGEGGRGGE